MIGGTNPDEQLAHGKRLLDPSQSGFDLKRGIAEIEAASAGGLGPATELLALFEAMGVARPQNWQRAFDLLQRAAEQGSPTARQQLLVLGRDRFEPVPREHDWAELRAPIVIEKNVKCADRRSLCEEPRIRAIEGFASRAECEWLVARARDRLQPAMIVDDDGAMRLDPGRTNRGCAFQVPDMDIVLEVVRARISSATKIPLPLFETSQVLHYFPGQAFKPHFDHFDGGANAQHAERIRSHGQRIATFVIYLNEDFEGGETDFPKVGVRYRGRQGDALFWANVDGQSRPDPLTLHAGLPPTAGEKWLFSQWIRDRVPAAQ